ncbi:MAG: FAD-dependent oxidoreductase [Halobacteriales archaeon]|nr:FAD-dependent oxidoreductase [Halobacteriales archaeon]
MAESYVIIGDGIAGSSAAETIREAAPGADITVVTDEGEPLYNRILIKEFAKGKIPEAPLSIHDETWYAKRDIELRLNTFITSVDTDARELTTHEGDVIAYDQLLVATGGTPQPLPVPGSDATGIHHFWTFQDARKIAENVSKADAGVVVGAGLLGIDFAAICAAREVRAHYLMRGECWWRYALSEEGAEIVHQAMADRGVEPVLESGVEEFETDEDGNLTAAIDTNGDRYPADFAGVAIGLNYNTEFLQDTAVETDDGIIVDEHMATSVDGIYAAGDITKFHDVILNDQTQNGSWGSAKEQGATAGRNMVAGEDEAVFRWVPSYSITHFDFPFLSFGHPTIGDANAERKYSETEWRRLTFKDGKLIGGVLIGDISAQSAYKTLIREERVVEDQVEALLEKKVDLDALAPAQEQ